MEEIREAKSEMRRNMVETIEKLPEDEIIQKNLAIENRLFEFANFLEAAIVLLYLNRPGEVSTGRIIEKCYDFGKMVILPVFNIETGAAILMKVDNIDTDLAPGPRGGLEPDRGKCKVVPIECIDIAIVPGIAFDEKGCRLGTGEGCYDRLIPDLPVTTRKVALTLEAQMTPQVPMESHDKHVDIIITDERIIYKI
jgi:5-formyltetrahydrofolate cyclo-ligase